MSTLSNTTQLKKGGRPRRNAERQYFEYIEAEDLSYCQIDNCNVKIKGNHVGNLGKHLARFHQTQWKAIAALIDESTKQQLAQNSLITVHLTAEDIKEACLEMVTIEGRPFSAVDSNGGCGFRRILDAVLHAPELSNKITISPATIRQMVVDRASEVRQHIKEEIKGRMVHLKVDGATRYDRSFLGVNVQFVENGIINLRTLGLIELKKRHTSENLEEEIKTILDNYEVSIQQIFSFTTDNGANMIKLGKLLIEAQRRDAMIQMTNDASTEHNDCDQESGDEDENGVNNEDVGMDINIDFDDYDDATEMPAIDNSRAMLLTSEATCISNIRCAAHTLQLAVHDALRGCKEIKQLIVKVREAARGLRTPNVRIRLEKSSKIPKLDVVTRWHSTYDMFCSVLEHKEFCVKYPKAHKSLAALHGEWKNIEDVLMALRPAKIATKRLQEEQLTLGSFYGIWLECKFETREIAGVLASRIYDAMCLREVHLMENDALLACLYLDPRFSLLLTEERHEDAAINKLVNLWSQLEKNERGAAKSHSALIISSSPKVTTTVSDNQSSQPLQPQYQSPAFLKVLNAAIANRAASQHTTRNIRQQLIDFRESIMVPPETNILQWWELQKNVHPQIYLLAKIVNGAAATEVSVERLFSGVHYIYSALRTNLKSNTLNDIIIIRCNDKFKRNIENTSKTTEKRKMLPEAQTDVTPAKSLCNISMQSDIDAEVENKIVNEYDFTTCETEIPLDKY